MPVTWFQYEQVIWALTVWREASNQSHLAKVAVAFAIKNRVSRPSWWGRTLVEVCTKREQFTSMNTKTDDPNLRRWPQDGDKAFQDCLEIVDGIDRGIIVAPMRGADSYYDTSIPAPWWARQHPERYLGEVGAFKFYDMDQDVEAGKGLV